MSPNPTKEPGENGTDSGSASPGELDSGSPPVASADGLGAFSDDFEGNELDSSWMFLNRQMFDWELKDGQLQMGPLSDPCDQSPFCVWFEADQGPGLVKLIQGNFMVTSRVHARSASEPEEAPQSPYLFAGLIARDPRSDDGPENYVFSVVGHRDHLTNELKNTVDDSSRVSETGIRENADLDLRICRVAQRFMLLNREIGTDAWVETQRYDRTEQPMSTTLQVGLIAYNYETPADVVGQFEHITFTQIATFADCTAD